MLESNRKLLVRNTGAFITVDSVDWQKAKEVSWRFIDGKVIAPNDLTYEEVCGFPQGMKNRANMPYVKLRRLLIPEDKSYEYSEYHGRFILR